MDYKKETFPIKGMHCSKCVSVIERTLMEMDGIDNAVVSLQRKHADVSYNPSNNPSGQSSTHFSAWVSTVNLENINRELNSIGYEIGEEKTLLEKIKEIYKNIRFKGGNK